MRALSIFKNKKQKRLWHVEFDLFQIHQF